MQLPVYNTDGEKVDSIEVSEYVFGVPFNEAVVHQAMVRQRANARQGTSNTKTRSEVAGSTKKLFRQKGTGNARVGTRRTGKRVGGGMIFAKAPRDFRQAMPRRQRMLARDSAVLAKLRSNEVVVVDGLSFEQPRTKDFVAVLQNLKIDRSCLVAVPEYNENVYKSVRNVPKVDVLPVADLNAADIINHRRMLFTKDALTSFLDRKAGGSQNGTA